MGCRELEFELQKKSALVQTSKVRSMRRYGMLPDRQMEIIPRIWEKCTRLRSLRIQSPLEANFPGIFTGEYEEYEETIEAFGNFHRLIYQLQVRGLTNELQKTINSV